MSFKLNITNSLNGNSLIKVCDYQSGTRVGAKKEGDDNKSGSEKADKHEDPASSHNGDTKDANTCENVSDDTNEMNRNGSGAKDDDDNAETDNDGNTAADDKCGANSADDDSGIQETDETEKCDNNGSLDSA